MRKVTAVLFLWIGSTLNAGADAAYLIKLKNGNEYITDRYWQKGTQVLFDSYGGIFGIEKTFVAKIEKTDKPLSPITSATIGPELTPIKTSEKDGGEGKKNLGENPEISAKRNEDDPIFKHFQTIRTRAKSIDGMLTSELNRLAKDLGELKRAMQLSGKTNDFLTEFGEIHDLSDRVEELLKERR
jgi:hypothetical protein